MHQIGADAASFAIIIPPTGGDVSIWQPYPLTQFQYVNAKIIKCDPFIDLVLLESEIENEVLPENIRIEEASSNLSVGKPVKVIGYPFSVIGSIILACSDASISALLVRTIMPGIQFPEIGVNHLTHAGSSGSAIVDSETGKLIGILRGSIAPPVTIKMGSVPLGSDSSLSIATSSLSISTFLKGIQSWT